MTDWLGRTVPNVTLQKLLGRSRMAEVYLGMHTTLNRPVAVKILRVFLLDDPTLIARFQNEASATILLRHPNIIQVLDFDLADDQPYIVMELLESLSLADYLGVQRRTSQTLPRETVVRLITTMAAALDHAHSQGMIHRDLKPANVLLRRQTGAVDPTTPLPADVDPVLTDFGVMQVMLTAIRTAPRAVIGTPVYMSPEQISGSPVDIRSDVYSLGVVLYEMLAGRLPFASETDPIATALVKHITETPSPLPDASHALQAVVQRALAKKPHERYQKAGALALDLRKALELPPPQDDHPTTILRHADPESGRKRSMPLLVISTVLIGVITLLAFLLSTGMLKLW